MTTIAETELRKLYDYDAETRLVSGALATACEKPRALLRFLGRYVSWNGRFGAGVASLAGKIGRSRELFSDGSEPVTMLADRSVLVGSYFFDAARDEFDDRDEAHRDTHRCLAQAMIKGIILHGRKDMSGDAGLDDGAVNELLADPIWLTALQDRVRTGYGDGSSDSRPGLFRAMGFHLGSEVLADKEFSVLDDELRKQQSDLVTFLQATKVDIAGEQHGAYHWLSIHSGHGGGAEADHFAWAVKGVNLAFQYAPPQEHDELRHQVHAGFVDFVYDHREFFQRANVA